MTQALNKFVGKIFLSLTHCILKEENLNERLVLKEPRRDNKIPIQNPNKKQSKTVQMSSF